jgi:hypothetical protein
MAGNGRIGAALAADLVVETTRYSAATYSRFQTKSFFDRSAPVPHSETTANEIESEPWWAQKKGGDPLIAAPRNRTPAS